MSAHVFPTRPPIGRPHAAFLTATALVGLCAILGNSTRYGVCADRAGTRQRAESRSGRAKGGLPSKVLRYATAVVRKYDQNGNQQLESAEWQRMQGQPANADRDGNGVITISEFAEHVADYGRRRNIRLFVSPVSSGSMQRAGGSVASPDESQLAEPAGTVGPSRPTTAQRQEKGRFYVPVSALPKGLPPWFRTRDVNGDGQITFAEYSPGVSDTAAKEFARYDGNGDGILVPEEFVRPLSPSRSLTSAEERARNAGSQRPSANRGDRTSADQRSQLRQSSAEENASRSGTETSSADRADLRYPRYSKNPRYSSRNFVGPRPEENADGSRYSRYGPTAADLDRSTSSSRNASSRSNRTGMTKSGRYGPLGSSHSNRSTLSSRSNRLGQDSRSSRSQYESRSHRSLDDARYRQKLSERSSSGSKTPRSSSLNSEERARRIERLKELRKAYESKNKSKSRNDNRTKKSSKNRQND